MKTKTAFIAVIGRANVGKSSFINRVVGNKVAIVSDKPQTTRTRIMGVKNFEDDKSDTQIVFIDTPGFHKPKNVLGEQMVKATENGLFDVDGVLLMVDAAPEFKFSKDNIPPAETELIKALKKRNLKCILALNKIDKLQDKSSLLEMIAAYSELYNFSAIHPISVSTGNGIEEISKDLISFAKEGPHYFPKDVYSDQPDKVMVAELIREKILRLYEKEIPHGTAVEIERFYERDTKEGEPILMVETVVYCEKESHKGIIIGKGGAALKKVGTLARKDIEKFFGMKVSLKLWIKVKEDWRNRKGIIHSLGLD